MRSAIRGRAATQWDDAEVPEASEPVDAVPSGPVLVPERRLVPALAVLVSMAVPFILPPHLAPGPVLVLVAIQGAFLVAVAVADPGRIDARNAKVRALSLALVGVIAASAAWATGRLIYDLFAKVPQSNDAGELLIAGGVVWLEMVIAFAFVYWELDGGGPVERVFAPRAKPDLAFPQHMNPELAADGWRPIFGDHLYLSVTNAMAFSPTDVMPLVGWAKAAMALQSVISVAILSLVVANSVNLMG